MAPSKETVKGILAVIGGFLVHLTLGTAYTFGNMNSYIASYLRFESSSKYADYSITIWIGALAGIGQGTLMSFGGLLQKKIGARFTCLLGSFIMSSGVTLTYFSIQVNIYCVMITYGMMFGIGIGLSYAVAIANAMTWFPIHKGLVGGFVVGGFGGGSFIFTMVQTHFINPDNIDANYTMPDGNYFDDPAILSRIPQCFLLLGGIYAAMQLIGVLLIFEKQPSELNVPLTPNEEPPGMTDNPVESIQSTSQSSSSQSLRKDMRVKEIIRTREYWILWSCMLLNSMGILYISTYYKVFGTSFINDDILLATIGSLSAIFNFGGRIFWGKMGDIFQFKTLMRILAACMSVMLGTFYLTSYVYWPMYCLWVFLLFGLFSGNFALFPIACANSFGHRKMAVNYGLIFTSQAIAGVSGSFLSNMLLHYIGYLGLFCLGSGYSVLSFILLFFFREKGHPKHDVSFPYAQQT